MSVRLCRSRLCRLRRPAQRCDSARGSGRSRLAVGAILQAACGRVSANSQWSTSKIILMVLSATEDQERESVVLMRVLEARTMLG